jgi:hypothetical protein
MAKVKGSSMLNAVKALRLKKDVSRAILPGALHHYLADRVLVSSWYPEEDLLGLLKALVKILPDPGMDVYEFMGLMSARTDLSGVYSNMFRPGDPAGSLKCGSVIWQSHHDTGKLEVVVASQESAVVRLAGFALPSREICGTIKGWIREHITTAGAKDVVVVKSQCVVKGDPECLFEASWHLPAGVETPAG